MREVSIKYHAHTGSYFQDWSLSFRIHCQENEPSPLTLLLLEVGGKRERKGQNIHERIIKDSPVKGWDN